MRRVLFVITVLVLILAACAPNEPAATQESTYPSEPSYPSEPPTSIPVDLTPAQLAAAELLAETLGLDVDQIKIVSTEAVTWPDGCLGIVKVGVMCTQAEVPGFKILLEAGGQQYEFHTNEDGSVVLSAEDALSAGPAEATVIKQLASNLGLEESDIQVVSSEVVEFSDACLGITQEDVMCAQVVTPGRIIVLEAKGMEYEYHTSEGGDRVQPASLALVWKREGGIAGFCDTLTVFRSGEVFTSSCKAQTDGKMGTIAELLNAPEREQFQDWIAGFAEVKLDASDPKGVADQMVVTLDFFGIGSEEPGESEQQELLTFAQDLHRQLAK